MVHSRDHKNLIIDILFSNSFFFLIYVYVFLYFSARGTTILIDIYLLQVINYIQFRIIR